MFQVVFPGQKSTGQNTIVAIVTICFQHICPKLIRNGSPRLGPVSLIYPPIMISLSYCTWCNSGELLLQVDKLLGVQQGG
jgi:hypothetical protein